MYSKSMLVAFGLAWANLAGTSTLAQDKLVERLSMGQMDTQPQPIDQACPVYPYEMSKAAVVGQVTVRFVIDINGHTREVRMIKANNPWFVRPAIDAIRKWRFKPARNKGALVEATAEQTIDFSVEGLGRGGMWGVQKQKEHTDLPPEMQWETAPEPRWTTCPVYPFDALVAKQKGETYLSFLVGPNGRVLEAKLLDSTTPEMGQAALAMIDAWQFAPAKNKKGEPCFAMLNIKHTFLLSSRSDAPVSASGWAILDYRVSHPDKIVSMKDLDAIPKLLWKSDPVYPSKLLKDGRMGEAVMEFFIDEEGDAQLPRIISATEPEFGYAAAQAIITWHFENPLKGGKPVVTRARIPIKFQHP